MARKGSKENPVTSEELQKAAEAICEILKPRKPFEIIEGHIKDDFCNYVLEITDGPKIGTTNSVKGKLIIDKDMRKIFAILNVHLAFIDDVFKHADKRFDYINAMHGDPLTTLYNVTGFKISGDEENRGVILIGTKYVSGGGRINLVTPKIPLDENSSYKWKEELRDAVEKARLEVELYEKGKGTPVEPDEEDEKPKAKQGKMKFEAADKAELTMGVPDETADADFENAEM